MTNHKSLFYFLTSYKDKKQDSVEEAANKIPTIILNVRIKEETETKINPQQYKAVLNIYALR